MSIIVPTFQESSFLFSGEVPLHIEGYPQIPNYVGMYAIFGVVDGSRTYPLAVDLITCELAELVSRARGAKQESDIGLYRYTDDVYIHAPDGSDRRIYCGRSL